MAFAFVLLPPPTRLCNARRCPGFVCLSVCLLATLWKSYRTDLHENFIIAVSRDNKDWLNLGSHSPPDPGLFKKDSSTLRGRAFSHIIRLTPTEKNLIGSSWKFYHKRNSEQGSSRQIVEVIRICIRSLDTDSGLDQIRHGGGLRSPSDLVVFIHFTVHFVLFC